MYPRAKTIELTVLTAVTAALRFLPEYDSKHTCKTYTDLQKSFSYPSSLEGQRNSIILLCSKKCLLLWQKCPYHCY